MHVVTDEIVGVVTDADYGPAKEHDITRTRELIHEDTTSVHADAGYLGMPKREEFQALGELKYRVACRPGCPGRLKTMPQDSLLRKNERHKASVRSKVEHVFKRIKLDMGYVKTRNRGIAKSAHRINTMLAVTNLLCFECWCRRCTA